LRPSRYFILDEHHVSSFWELGLFIMYVAGTVFFGGLLWTLYIAIEPFVRRRRPQLLVSWTRLLSGEWQDPLIGRDVLVGCAMGIVQAVIPRLAALVSSWSSPEQFVVYGANLRAALGTTAFIGQLAYFLTFNVVIGLAELFLFLFLRSVLRRDLLAGLVWVLLVAPSIAGLGLGPLVAIAGALSAALLLFVPMRFGLVALTTGSIVFWIIHFVPFTFDAAWYAGYGYAALVMIAALAVYGFRTSLGGRPLLNSPAADADGAGSR
jgi:serine/threonine-protein kinase